MSIYRLSEGNIPSYKLGDTWLEGSANKYDRIALSKGITPVSLEDLERYDFVIKSGFTRVKVHDVEKIWTPKEDVSKSMAWLHYGDYSGDGRFELAIEFSYSYTQLYYELADLLGEPMDAPIRIIHDENDNQQFFIN